MPPALWDVSVHTDDFRDVTGESDGELVEVDFQGVTGKSVDEPMLSHNQLKVGKSFCRDDDRGEIGAGVLA